MQPNDANQVECIQQIRGILGKASKRSKDENSDARLLKVYLTQSSKIGLP